MKRLPPAPFAGRLVVTSVVVWGVLRAFLTALVRSLAGTLDIAPDPSSVSLLGLAMAVAWIVLRDLTRCRERVFAEDLGISPFTVMGIAVGSVAICEVVLAVGPALLAGAGGVGP